MRGLVPLQSLCKQKHLPLKGLLVVCQKVFFSATNTALMNFLYLLWFLSSIPIKGWLVLCPLVVSLPPFTLILQTSLASHKTNGTDIIKINVCLMFSFLAVKYCDHSTLRLKDQIISTTLSYHVWFFYIILGKKCCIVKCIFNLRKVM